MIVRHLIYIALLHVAGCIPATATLVPEIRDRVVNGTGEPIAGAKVRVTSADLSNDEPAFAVTTDRRGRFHRAEQTRRFMAPLVPAHAISPGFVATASHGGARSSPKHFGRNELLMMHAFGVTNKSRSYDLGDLVVYDGG